MAIGALVALAVACGPPSPMGRWQVEGNPNAGLEIRDGGQFQGELGGTDGGPRLRLEGTWAANGSDVTFNVGGALAQRVPGLTLIGKIQGDTMVVSPPQEAGLTGTINLRKQPDRR